MENRSLMAADLAAGLVEPESAGADAPLASTDPPTAAPVDHAPLLVWWTLDGNALAADGDPGTAAGGSNAPVATLPAPAEAPLQFTLPADALNDQTLPDHPLPASLFDDRALIEQAFADGVFAEEAFAEEAFAEGVFAETVFAETVFAEEVFAEFLRDDTILTGGAVSAALLAIGGPAAAEGASHETLAPEADSGLVLPPAVSEVWIWEALAAASAEHQQPTAPGAAVGDSGAASAAPSEGERAPAQAGTSGTSDSTPQAEHPATAAAQGGERQAAQAPVDGGLRQFDPRTPGGRLQIVRGRMEGELGFVFRPYTPQLTRLDPMIYRAVPGLLDQEAGRFVIMSTDQWQQRAEALLQYHPRQDELVLNRNVMLAYALMHQRNPQVMPWVGPATLASQGVGEGLTRLGGMRLLPIAAAARRDLLAGHLAIYRDVYWQFMAYEAGGFAEVWAHRDAIAANLLNAWVLVAQFERDLVTGQPANPRDVLDAALLVAHHEQWSVLPRTTFGTGAQRARWGTLSQLDGDLGLNILSSSIPGTQPFGSFTRLNSPGMPVNFADPRLRYAWIAHQMNMWARYHGRAPGQSAALVEDAMMNPAWRQVRE